MKEEPKLRVAVVGCGAVAERYHLPVLAGHEGVRLTALVDRDVARAKSLAADYRVDCVLTDADQLTPEIADAAVICTPAWHHAPCGLALLHKGLHVLVEKPLATTLADAEALVAAAEQAGRVLSVGVFRRLYPSVRMLKAALHAELLGRPLSFHLEGGAVYGWEAATLGNMLKSQAGGGVLMDMGPHYFDQLLSLFDGPGEVLEYRDNALGGIESDCVVRLLLAHRGQPVPGQVELSRTRNLGNELRVTCERGELAIAPNERFRVEVRPNDLTLRDPRDGSAAAARLQLSWAHEPEVDWRESFRAEIDDWLNAIREHREPELSGRSALPVMQLIDQCYRQVERLSEPWVEHPLINRAVVNAPADVQLNGRRVLVTGATGFIGCRVAEILSQREGWQVRAAVHNPAHASRVARLPVELVQADLTRAEDVQRLVEDCDAIVHCAIGTETWDRGRVFRVTVDGTRTLVEAARKAGVRRFVHLSTIAVHSDDYRGVIDETTPAAPVRGSTYGESKLAAERIVLGGGVPCVVIRPGCVYGPFGKTFIMRPMEFLARGRLVLSGSEQTPSNTVYVDNLVEAIVRSLEADERVAGAIVPLADDDGWTWGQFYGYFAERLGVRYLTEDRQASEVGNGHARCGWLRAVRELATSDEMKSMARKALWTDPVGTVPRTLLERSPGLKRRLKKLLRMESAAVHRRAEVQPPELLRITPRFAEVRSDAARHRLGWQPLLSRAECLERTWAWLAASRLAPVGREKAPQ